MSAASAPKYFYRFNDPQQTSISLSGIKYANKEDVLKVIEVLKNNPHIRSIDLKDVNMHATWLAMVLDAAATCPKLRSLDLTKNPLQHPALGSLLNALPHWPQLQTLSLAGCTLNGKSIGRLAPALSAHCPALASLDLDDNAITAAGASTIAKMAAGKPLLRQLHLANNSLGDACLPAIAALLQQPQLTKCDLMYNHFSAEGMDRFTNDICRNRTLVSSPLLHPQLDTICEKNRQATITLITKLKDLDTDKPQWERLPAHILSAMYARLPAIEMLIAPPELHDKLTAHIDSLPKIDAVTATSDGLLAADARGYRPLDNPALWKQLPTLLAAKGSPLSTETLLKQDRHGETYMRAAIASNPVTALPQLNAAGIRIPLSALMNSDRSFSGLMEQFIADENVAQLFTFANLKGEAASTVKDFYRALPPEQKAQVTNLHSLMAELSPSPQKGQTR